VDDTLAMAALIQAVVVRLHKLQRQNLSFRIYRRRVIDENRWRASRYGLDGKLIDFGREAEVETRSLINEILEFVETEVDELGSRREIEHVEKLLREGTGADRQLEVWEKSGHDMKAVVDLIVRETYEQLSVEEPGAASTAGPSV
jgi:carboxylate-amine ligase